MDLYLMRHGPAASANEWHGDDESRPLTKSGAQVTAKVARRLAKMGVRPDAVLTSPYLRAEQTAAIAAKALGVEGAPTPDGRLEPGFGLPELRQILEEHGDAGALLLVGHESDFSVLIGEVIGGGRVAMKKAGVALVEVPQPPVPSGRLIWLGTPALLGG